MAPTDKTADRILEVARDLVQKRGYHAFSYRDVADHVGIRTASIHYHFPTKTDLIEAVLQRVEIEFGEALQQCDRESRGVVDRLQRFASIFVNSFGDGDRLCPFCVIACAQDSISEQVSNLVRSFWSSAEAWLVKVLRDGNSTGELRFEADVETVANTMLATIEGAMLAARVNRDRTRIAAAFDYLIGSICPDGGWSPLDEVIMYGNSATDAGQLN